MMAPRVFGIGFHKTGTTSLGAALEYFGYRVCHGATPVRLQLSNRRMLELLAANEVDEILEVAAAYDACEDNPWFVLYREIDKRFPGSRFILTLRDEERWLQSALRYYGESESELRRWIYGVDSPVGNERRFIDRYRQHNGEVLDYFAGRESDLLIVDWERGDGWRELAGFLQHVAPETAFPRLNIQHAR